MDNTSSSIPVQMFNGRRFVLYPGQRYFKTTKRGGKMLHRAVWEHFHGPIPARHIIHHKDHDKHNNDISNLECITYQQHFALHFDDERKAKLAIAREAARTPTANAKRRASLIRYNQRKHM